MENDDSNSFNDNHSFQNEQDSNKSFVGKVKSRMTGLLSSSLNKLFGSEGNLSLIRRREDDAEEDSYQLQPPPKRIKRPSPSNDSNNVEFLNSVAKDDTLSTSYASTRLTSQNSVGNAFVEPIAGPSGIKPRKTLTDGFNYNLQSDDKDSDSGESTSGYSSMARISHKETTNSAELKNNETSANNSNCIFNASNLGRTRSLFNERSLSPQMNSSLSSRRPCFNASTFGSPSFVDRTLSTKRITSSPFYSGRTMYGGSSAYNKQQRNLNNNRVFLAPQIEVKQMVNAEETVNTPLSKTARRILETLEEFTSSTVSDIKKIPSPRKIHSGFLSKYTSANPYSIRDRKTLNSVPNKELIVPTIPDMIQMKRKEQLQNTTESVRKIASNSLLNSEQYKIRNEDTETRKHTNKCRKKFASVRQKSDKEVAEIVNLPNVVLPITNLPKFDLMLPLPSPCSKPSNIIPTNIPSIQVTPNNEANANIKIESSHVMNEKLQSKKDGIVEYKFSDPEILAENLKAITAINDFKFSDPVFKKFNQTSIATNNLLNFKSFEAPTLKLKKKLPSSQTTNITNSVPKLLLGSVEDVLTKNKKDNTSLEKFKPAPGMWECNTCLIRNLPEKNFCVACNASKSVDVIKKDATVGFGDKFKMSLDKWECPVCMIRNDNSNSSCVACTTPRVTNNASVNVTTTPLVTNTFGNKFKPAKDTWECSTCMIRNQASADKCVACETEQPGAAKKNNVLPKIGFGALFQKKSNEWECGVCMVRNPNDKLNCLSCETPNPQASKSSTTNLENTTPKKIPAYKFGIFPGAKTTITGFTDDPKSDIDSVNNGVPISSIFGTTKTTKLIENTSSPKIASGFTFGIPTNDKVIQKSESNQKLLETKIAPVSSINVNSTEPLKTEKQTNLSSTSQVEASNTPKFGIGNSQTTKLQETSKVDSKNVNSQMVEKPAFQSSGFTFGKVNSQADKEKFVSPLNNFVVAAPTSTNNKEKLSQPTGFTFGSSSSQTKKRSLNSIDEQDLSTSKRSTLPSTTFNSTQPISTESDSEILKKAMNIGKESTEKSENKLFGSLTSTTAASASISSNSFGFTSQQAHLPASTSANSNTFNFFSKNSTTEFGKDASKVSSLFKAGNVKQPEQKSVFDTTATAHSKVSANMFAETSANSAFGVPSSSITTPATVASNMFANTSTTSVFGTQNKPIFETSSKSSVKPEQAAFKTPNKITFDTSAKPLFDIPSSTSTFGSTTVTSFGSAASEVKPFTFGPSVTESSSIKPSVFGFGSSADKAPESSQQPPPPVFGFNSSAASGPSNAFNFSSPASTPNTNFGFNSPKITNPPPSFQSPAASGSNMFGSSTPIQPMQNGGFNFGSSSSNNTVKTGFNFGNAVPAAPQFNSQPIAAAPTGLFGFGSSTQNNAQTTTGFNFGSTAAPPAFNANATPSFNFTGGATPTFSAQPTTGDNVGIQTRKKIKAVRRALQR